MIDPPDADGLTDPIVAEVREFAHRHRLGELSKTTDAQGKFPRETFREMGRSGLLGLHFGPEVGGRHLPLGSVGAALFALAEAAGTTFAKLSLQPEFSSVLADRGSPDQVETYFRPLLRGNLLVGNQITEPTAGSDLRGLAMTAGRDGDGYVLNGVKTEVAFADEADAALVYAVAPGGVSVFVVPQDLKGIDRSTSEDLGERWMRRGRVEYRDVHIPQSARVGEEGAALEYLKPELTRERLLLAAIYLGVARSSWSEVVRHTGSRETFGRPLWSHQAVGFPLVEDWARLDAAWLYVRHALERLSAGADVEAEAALSKWLSVDVALATIDHAMQFHGGRGYSSDLPHAQRWRDVRSGAIAHGPSEIMRMIAARRLWPREKSQPTPHR